MNNGLDVLLSEWVSLNTLTPAQTVRIRDAALRDRSSQYEMVIGMIRMQYEIIRENFSFMTKPWWTRDNVESA